MRTVATFLAVVALSAAAPTLWPRPAAAQETIVMEDAAMDVGPEAPGACGCRNLQAPPWHGTVSGDPCGPCCPPPNVFHANPCGQLRMKHTAHLHGQVLPPCFPRMHGRLVDGWWPTPRPISLPRCPNCGAHIEGGF